LFSAFVTFAQQPEIMSSSDLKIALKKLTVLGSALYIAAHPDDENTALLAYFSKEKLLRTGYLTITRGGGGQNLIGSEKGEILSLLRTQELLAARQIDGAEQFFTRAVDFGYSKSAVESISTWGKDEILADMVWIIRKFKPQVLVTRFPAAGGGHGHHTASTLLAVEAFRAAGDPSRFPEQLKYLSVWKPKRILWNSWRPQLENRSPELPELLSLDLGQYNPLLGKSYSEIAALSRSMHKTQGFGSVGRRGSYLNYFEHLAGAPASGDLFEDVDQSWNKIPGSQKVRDLLQKAVDSFAEENPAEILPLLVEASIHMEKLPESYWIIQKKKEIVEVIRNCAGLWIEAIADKYVTSPGGEVKVTLTLVNRSSYPFTVERIETPVERIELKAGEELKNNQPYVKEFLFRVNKNTPYSHPYWLKEKPAKGRFYAPDPRLTGMPCAPYPVTAMVVLGAQGKKLSFSAPVVYRHRDPVAGERIRSIEIVPPVTVNFLEKIFYFPDKNSRKIRLQIQSGPAPVEGKLKINLNAGWHAEPAVIPFKIEKEFAGQRITLNVTPPQKDSISPLTIDILSGNTIERGRSLIRIDYPHVPVRTLVPEAEANLVRVNLKKTGSRIAYIMGSGDDIPKYLSQVGYRVGILSDEALQQEDLQEYDAVIMGIRAYNTRSILKYQQQRLLDYVFKGGNLIVQYNVSRGLKTERIGPYPLKLSRSRVTDEYAAIKLLDPNHPLFNYPNKIFPADFDNWIQERGLYFAAEWAPEYKTLLACCDEGEEPQSGGLLLAAYGKGNFIYSGYSFFRQLPAGVPGALKLFINMISLQRPATAAGRGFSSNNSSTEGDID
jgi:LmbE family N-acetylglucosaminyl deacetylase